MEIPTAPGFPDHRAPGVGLGEEVQEGHVVAAGPQGPRHQAEAVGRHDPVGAFGVGGEEQDAHAPPLSPGGPGRPSPG